jgi:transcriptional regulator with XRE-family HTH domain
MAELIGSILKQRREARHLSIDQVAEQTRVRVHYLQALENDDLSSIPSMPQARGFLRIYAEFLGLNLDELFSAAHSAETQPPASPADSLVEPVTVPVQSNAPAPDQPRSNFFGGLRGRFTRHPSAETATPEPEPSVSSTPEPEPEVFVPIHVHEELPAAPEEESSAPEPTQLELAIKPARARKSLSKKISNKKPVRTPTKKKTVKTIKPSKTTSAGRKAQVKKKIVKLPSKKVSSSKKKTPPKKQPRPKRVSSPRKASSSRPRRRSVKPNRKLAKLPYQAKSRRMKRRLPKKSRK